MVGKPIGSRAVASRPPSNTRRSTIPNAIAAKPLSELELSVRSRHCMTVLGLKTVGDLIQRTEAELMTIKNFGQTSLNEVKQKLAELGLGLAASTEPLAPPADLVDVE